MKRTPRNPTVSRKLLRHLARTAAGSTPATGKSKTNKTKRMTTPQPTKSNSLTNLISRSTDTTDDFGRNMGDRGAAPPLLTPAPTPSAPISAQLSAHWFDVVT